MDFLLAYLAIVDIKTFDVPQLVSETGEGDSSRPGRTTVPELPNIISPESEITTFSTLIKSFSA